METLCGRGLVQKEYRRVPNTHFLRVQVIQHTREKACPSWTLDHCAGQGPIHSTDSLRNGRRQAFFGYHLLRASHDPLAGGTTLFRMAKVGQPW